MDYVIEQVDRVEEYYTDVIGSCDNIVQLGSATKWIEQGYERLEAVADCLPRRRRKMCRAIIDHSRTLVMQINVDKGTELIDKKVSSFIDHIKPRRDPYRDLVDMCDKEIDKLFPFGNSRSTDALDALLKSCGASVGLFPGIKITCDIAKREDPQKEDATETGYADPESSPGPADEIKTECLAD